MTINAELQRRAARLVEREVHACMSSLVATLAAGYGDTGNPVSGRRSELASLTEQAMELAAPVPDYESAAREAGWAVTRLDGAGESDVEFFAWRGANAKEPDAETGIAPSEADAWQWACQDDIEPYELEVFEHWAVSSWLAEKLIAKGERVDTDFAGLNVWARTTAGQAISVDSVIGEIVSETGYASAA